MSEIKDETLKKLDELAALEKKKKEVAEKELYLRGIRVDNDLERVNKNLREMEAARGANYGGMSEEQIAKIQKDSRDYIEAARNCMKFINSAFEGAIPYFRKNLILIGGKTGEGKSTTVANIVATTLGQKNPEGKPCRVLVITNEERTEDVYNRITCYAKGWHYTNHNKFTNEQVETFHKYIPVLSKFLTVIDDSWGSTPGNPVSGTTTSLEGIQSIFDNLIATNSYYDAVLIDYYQNVSSSKKNSSLAGWQVQEQLASVLDQYKNVYPAPIILMAQVSPPNEENTVPFKNRIEGRKSILNVCTSCIEMIADRENLRTEWVIHKSRFNEAVGNRFYTGYDMGRFVLHSEEFKTKVSKLKERRAAEEQDRQIGIPLNKEKTDGEVS